MATEENKSAQKAQSAKAGDSLERLEEFASEWRQGVRHQYADAAARMPTSPQDRAILKARAQLLAADADDEDVGREVESYVRFRLGGTELYGIPYSYAEEIISTDGLEPVPCTPGFVAGVINRRGALLTVLDVAYFFDVASGEAPIDEQIVVVRHGDIVFGILTSMILGDQEFEIGTLDDPLPSKGVQKLDYVRGIHRGRTTILDVGAIASDPAIIQDTSNAA